MNTVGFCNKWDEGIIYEKYFQLPDHKIEVTKAQREKIIEYLKQGERIFSITLSLFDEDDSFIAPYIVYTDGEWLWPSHLIDFIEKNSTQYLKMEFLEYLTKKDFKFSTKIISKEDVVRFFQENLMNLG